MSGGNNTTITLTVDTTGINEENKNTKVVLSDDRGDTAEAPGQPNIYQSTVNAGKIVTWKGVSVNGTDIINITAVTKKSDSPANVLKTINAPIKGSNGSGDTISAVVVGNKQTGVETYTVSFDINGEAPIYPIDPQLRMK